MAIAGQAAGRRLAAGCPWLTRDNGERLRLHIPLHEVISWSTRSNTAELLPPELEIVVDWPEGVNREVPRLAPLHGTSPQRVTVSWPGLSRAAAITGNTSIYRDAELLSVLAPVLEGIACGADAPSIMTSDVQEQVCRLLGQDILIHQYRSYDHHIACLL